VNQYTERSKTLLNPNCVKHFTKEVSLESMTATVLWSVFTLFEKVTLKKNQYSFVASNPRYSKCL